MPNLIDITGQRYGRLVVVAKAANTNGRVSWLCRCDCGNEKVATSNALRTRTTSSCGCIRAENARKCGALCSGAANITHGLSHIPEYFIWKTMRQRAKGKGSIKDRHIYQGITCCDRWYDFALFIEDMGRRPSPVHSIDRIDGTKGYEPGNCRWATPKEQAQNRRPRSVATARGQS